MSAKEDIGAGGRSIIWVAIVVGIRETAEGCTTLARKPEARIRVFANVVKDVLDGLPVSELWFMHESAGNRG